MEILTVTEVATILKLPARTVRDLANPRKQNGEVRPNPIPAFRIGKLIRFRKSDVEAWIEELTLRP
jgi:excisionase family DNA binding protein